MIDESTEMQEITSTIKNLVKDVMKIEQKLNNITNNAPILNTAMEFNSHIAKTIEIEPKEINERKEEVKEPKEEVDELKEEVKPQLIISEKTGKVYLPYTKSDIEYYKKCGYKSEEEIVELFFTEPLKKYSNFAKSRVKERIYFNERTRKRRNNRIYKICNEFKTRSKATSCSNFSL